METITKDLADYIEQRVNEAMIPKEEKLKKLEQDKARLIRLTSELKNEIKNMRITVSMYEKRMNNPLKKINSIENKCVGCDFKINSPEMVDVVEVVKVVPSTTTITPSVAYSNK